MKIELTDERNEKVASDLVALAYSYYKFYGGDERTVAALGDCLVKAEGFRDLAECERKRIRPLIAAMGSGLKDYGELAAAVAENFI